MNVAVLALALAASTADCAAPAGWNEIAATAPRYVLLGEMHGSEQSPAMLADLVCTEAQRGKPILVALELGSDGDPLLQRAWTQPHAAFAKTLLETNGEWTARTDGATSQAMLAMLVRLHALKSGGIPIDVVAFNGARDDAQRERWMSLPGQGPHEAAQAENIRRAANARDYGRVFVLVGGLHARKRPVTLDVAFEPMAMRLAPASDILSLKMTYSAGTSWSCRLKPGLTPDGPVDASMIACKSYAVPGTASGDDPGIKLGGAEPDYDGSYFVGAIVASPPVGKTE